MLLALHRSRLLFHIFLFCNYGELTLDAFAWMNLLVQSTILGDIIESSRHHMGGSSEIPFDERLVIDYAFTPMAAITTRQESIHHKSTKNERGFKRGQIKARSDNGYHFMIGGRESLNVHSCVKTLLLRCKGEYPG